MLKKTFSRISVTTIACFLVAIVGCGPKLQKAGGVVKVDGKPIDQGTVGFYPIEPGRPSMAEVQPDGTFELSYLKPGDGLPPGEYKVTIVSDVWKVNTQAKAQEEALLNKMGVKDEMSMAAGQLIHVVPVEYNTLETTPLKQTVSASSSKFEFDIPTKKKR
jgi:hypothetical protein